jgi:hypothetical protein
MPPEVLPGADKPYKTPEIEERSEESLRHGASKKGAPIIRGALFLLRGDCGD